MRDLLIGIRNLLVGLLIGLLISSFSPMRSHAEWITCECSAYTPYDCGSVTATGEEVHVGGVACNFLPFGTIVVIDGIEYVVNDRCGIDGCIDIFMLSYDEAINFGRRTKEVYIKR